MNWILSNWPAVIAVVAALLGAAKLIVKLTPSTKDDAIVDKAEKVVDEIEKVVPAPTEPKA